MIQVVNVSFFDIIKRQNLLLEYSLCPVGPNLHGVRNITPYKDSESREDVNLQRYKT